MRSVEIAGRVFEYDTYFISYGEDVCSDPVTFFYEGTETITKRKWILFGPTIEVTQPKLVFKIYADSNNTRLSKEWWREKILNEISLLERSEEIDRGELC